MLGCSAEYHLSQSTLSKGALNQKVAGQCLSSAQNSLASIFAIECYRQRLGRNAIPLQISDHLLRGRARHFSSSGHRQDCNAFGPLKKRHCKSHGARLLCATVPRDQNIGADMPRRGWWAQEQWPATLEQSGFKRSTIQNRRIFVRPIHNDHVEGAAIIANEGFVLGRFT